RVKESLASGGRVVVDVTNITGSNRKQFHDISEQFGAKRHILLMDVSVNTSLQRNRTRARHVPEHVIMSMVTSLLQSGLPKPEEGQFYCVRPSAGTEDMYTLHSADSLSAEVLPSQVHAADLPISMLWRRARLPGPGAGMDLIGDVHGCFEEL